MLKKYTIATRDDAIVAFKEVMAHLESGGNIKLEVDYATKRSIQQNSYLWRVYSLAEKYYAEHLPNFYIDLTRAYGKKGLCTEVIHEMHKMRLDVKSTRALSSEACVEYTDNVRQYYWDEYELDIPPANEPPMGE